jgi:antitoxin component of RelBE/YafQ-DinJ toxin-antitoxin module
MMPTITYRTDEKTKEQLAKYAAEQNISINKAIDLMVCHTIAEKQAFTEFEKRAKKGDPQKALDILYSKADD